MKRATAFATVTLLIALVASACTAGSVTPEQAAAIETAARSASSLILTNDLSTSQLLDGRTGEVTSIREVVTDDRPILMWYWAPN